MNASTLDTFIKQISDEGRTTFTNQEIVDHFRIDSQTATEMIQDYLRVLSSDGDRLSRVIYRQPGTRTRNTVWEMGEKTQNVKRIVHQTASDLENRVSILLGSLEQMGVRNPGSKKAIGAALVKYTAAHQTLVDTIIANT